ncbi:MAG: phage major tail protein, TP901-1 family [Rhodobacteraceae bacterium]|nr:phage major tail protein, TP901-1 family [Paracoccaceae bacterium]
MAKQKGRELLIKIEDSGGGTFSPLAGLNSKSITINNSAIDVTTPDATTPGGDLWTEVLDGVMNVAVSGDGIFVDEAAELQMQAVAMTGTKVTALQIIVPSFGTFAGNWHIDSIEYGGETEGSVTFSISLSSTGAITFTAA